MSTQIATVGLNNISSEPESLNTDRAKRSDVSFSNALETEELRLREKEKLISSLPFSFLQNILSSVQLKFDFDFSTAAIDHDASNEKHPELGVSAKENPARTELNKISNSGEKAEQSGPAKLAYTMDRNTFVNDLLPNFRLAVGDIRLPQGLFDIRASKAKGADLAGVIDEIVEKARIVKEGEKTELSIALKPENLGEMLLSLTMKHGAIFISIAGDQDMKNLFEAQRAALEASLKRANINLGGLDISSNKDHKNTFVSGIEVPEILSPAPLIAAKVPDLPIIDPYIYGRLFGLSVRSVYSKA